MVGYLEVKAVHSIFQKTEQSVVYTKADVEFRNADLNKQADPSQSPLLPVYYLIQGYVKEGFAYCIKKQFGHIQIIFPLCSESVMGCG